VFFEKEKEETEKKTGGVCKFKKESPQKSWRTWRLSKPGA